MSSRGGFASSVLYVTDESLAEAQRTKEEREAGTRDRLIVFSENVFPYQLPRWTTHYVLWFLLDADETDESVAFTDSDITEILDKKFVPAELEFIWYRNPKPSILDGVTYHVQVFVRDKV